MDFCPKCSSILTPQKKGKSRVLVCRSCGYTKHISSKSEGTPLISENFNHETDVETIVIDEKSANLRTMPTVRAICPKCGHKVAYYWQVQTRAGDEGMTTFYRCVKCKQTWREY